MSPTRREITGFSNPTVKALRALREKKHRKAAGRFLAEGLRLLTDARESGGRRPPTSRETRGSTASSRSRSAASSTPPSGACWETSPLAPPWGPAPSRFWLASESVASETLPVSEATCWPSVWDHRPQPPRTARGRAQWAPLRSHHRRWCF